nr:formin-2-like [Penaeus vannamei]
MKAAVFLCFAVAVAAAAAMPPPGPGSFAGSFLPSSGVLQSFVPTPQQIQALQAIPPAPAPAPGTAAKPPPPSAVSDIIKKYQGTAAAFMPAAP